MLILALDTTTDLCSVALIRGAEVLAREFDTGAAAAVPDTARLSPQSRLSNSQVLLPMIDGLLAEAGVRLAALDAIAFGSGPGSFTGLRVACGVAQGLAFGIDRPLLPVGSLESMALACGEPRVIACLDARMGEIYFAAFERAADAAIDPATSHATSHATDAPTGRPHCLIEAAVAQPAAVCLPRGAGWIGCGNGFAVYADALQMRIEELCRLDASIKPLAGLRPDVRPHAYQVAQLAAIAFAAGEAIAPDLAAPRYVRNKVALDATEQAAQRSAVALALAGVR